jgi:CheY-like chemotaxis protein
MIDISQLSGTAMVVYTIGGLLSLVGVGKIVQMIMSRSWSQSDKQDDIETANDGKRIDADVAFVNLFVVRIGALETKVERLTEEQMSLTKTNIQLVSENEHLKETNQQQARQIESQATEIRDLRRELGDINRRFDELSGRVSDNATHAAAATKAEHQVQRLKTEWKPKTEVSVLIVEDNQDARDLLQFTFMARGIETKGFDNGMSALAWLNENEARVVLLDLAMPVMDGLTIAKNMRVNEGLSVGRVPAIIGFYSGQEPDAMLAMNKKEFDIREVFVKGKDLPDTVVSKVVKWLG